MKRSITDVVRRGFENALANWPLLLIRVAEGMLFVIIAVVALIAAIVPVIVSLGLNKFDPQNAESMTVLLELLAAHWAVLAYLVVLVTVLLVVFVGIHSFVEAGSARVYVEGERAAALVEAAGRDQFRAFTADRWFAGGRRDWWKVFWIYNTAWTFAGLVLLAPLLLLLMVMLLVRENAPVMVGVSCLGLALFLPFFIAVAVVTNVWCIKAIVICAVRASGALDSLKLAWAEFRADVWRHVAVALILFVLTLVGAMVFGAFSGLMNLSDSPGYVLALLPMQLASSLMNTIFSAVMAGWFLSCFVALTVESRTNLTPR